MDDLLRADKVRNARKKLQSFRALRIDSNQQEDRPRVFLSPKQTQDIIMDGPTPDLSVQEPPAHKRTRSRHSRTSSTLGGSDLLGITAGAGMPSIRAVEPMWKGWQVDEEQNGLEMPVFGSVLHEMMGKEELPPPPLPAVENVPDTYSGKDTADTTVEEQGRFRGFIFGQPGRSTAALSNIPSEEPVPQIPPIIATTTHRKRHSHTRSTSVSTRAAFTLPPTILEPPSSAIPPPIPPIRTPSPEEGWRTDERSKALSALEGRHQPSDSLPWTRRASLGVSEGERRSMRRRSRVSSVIGEKVEITLPSMEDSDEEPTGDAEPVIAEDSGTSLASFRMSSPNIASPIATASGRPFSFPAPTAAADTHPSNPGLGIGLALGIGALGASTSMASQATNLGTLVEEDEEVVPADDLMNGHPTDLGGIFTPDRSGIRGITSPSSVTSSNTSFKIRPLRLAQNSSVSTTVSGSVSSTEVDPRDSRRSLSIETPSPVGQIIAAKRFSWRRNESFAAKRSSTASSFDSRILHDVEDTEPRRAVFPDVPVVVDELKRQVEQLEMEKQTMQEDVDGWQARCHGLEMQLKHEKEQGVFLRERVRKLGDHLSSLSGMAATPAPYRPPIDSPGGFHSPATSPQLAMMRNELFKLTSTLKQLHAEKQAAKDQVEALRAELGETKRSPDTAWETRTSFVLPVEHTSPTPARTSKMSDIEDVHRIRAFAFPKSTAEPSADGLFAPSPTTFGASSKPSGPDPTDFQIPLDTPSEYGGYARDLPRGFGTTVSRCINFEHACGSCKGKLFVL